MRRIIIRLCGPFSLLLFVAAVGVAGHSYLGWRYQGLTLNTAARPDGSQQHYSITAKPIGIVISYHSLTRGALDPGWLPFSARSAPLTMAQCDQWYRKQGGYAWLGMGLLHGVMRPDGRGRAYEVAIPHWLTIVLTTVGPVLWVRGRWKARRGVDGLCPVCGYDLRATPDRCPECGSLATRRAAPG